MDEEAETFWCCRDQGMNLDKPDGNHRVNNLTCTWSSPSSSRFVVSKVRIVWDCFILTSFCSF